jgi:hypothetical protein
MGTDSEGKQAWLMGFGLSFLLALLFTCTPYWQLAAAAGFLGGLFLGRMHRAALSGFCGVTLAWGAYVLLQGAWRLLDQVGTIILGGSDRGPAIALIVVLVGGILGALGGAIGSGIRRLVTP